MDHHKEEVISVIVPVYNAEHYLEECILNPKLLLRLGL